MIYVMGWRDLLTVKRRELLADCFSGAWFRDMADRGLADQGDIEEMLDAANIVGQPEGTWFDPNVHGTHAQRMLVSVLGFEAGVQWCLDNA